MIKGIGLTATAVFVIAGFFVAAQTDPRGKSHMLHGTVEGINDFAQSIRVNQERIEGYSEARTATYGVDDASILKKIEVGDRIVATIYEKDNTLYDIQPVRFSDSPPVPPERRIRP